MVVPPTVIVSTGVTSYKALFRLISRSPDIVIPDKALISDKLMLNVTSTSPYEGIFSKPDKLAKAEALLIVIFLLEH